MFDFMHTISIGAIQMFVFYSIQLLGVGMGIYGVYALAWKEQGRSTIYLLLADIACVVMNISYIQASKAFTVQEVFPLLRMEFFCTMCFYYFFMLFITTYHSIRISEKVYFVWAFFEFVEYILLVDDHTHTMVFDAVSMIISKDGRFRYAIMDRGVMLEIRYGLLILCYLILLIYSILKLRKTSIRSKKSSLHFLIIAQTIVVVSTIADMTVDTPLNFIPMMSTVATFIIITGVITGGFVNISEVGRKWALDNMDNVVVIADGDRNLLYINDFAGRRFPELAKLKVGQRIVGDIVHAFEADEDKMVINGRVYSRIRNPLINEGSITRSVLKSQADFFLKGEQEADIAICEFLEHGEEKLLKIMPARVIESIVKNLDIKEVDGRIHVEKIKNVGRYGTKIRISYKDVIGYSILMVDITEVERLMNELAEQKEIAESAVAARSAFMSNMSHEIRTPMNAIVGMTDIMLRGELTKAQKGYLFNIKNSGKALLSLVNDILDFSKIDAGKMELVEAEYEPMSMLNDVRMIFQNRIGDKPIDLLFDIDENLPAKLYGDNLRVRQILINFGNNATKFTDEGSITVSIEVLNVQDDDITLKFAVKDTGMGIKEEDLGALFTPFKQVDQVKNHSKEGTGLGLSICKTLAELMGGHVGVESEYGKGSTFFFVIHQKVRSTKKAGKIDDAYNDNQNVEVIDFVAPTARVLLVDDNEINRNVAIGLLEPIQMQIEEAADGKQALEMILEKKNYDLILMDHMMPIMDGVEATIKLREQDDAYCKNVPVIALSANVIKEARDSFFAAGMNTFVSKPIEMKELCLVLKEYLPANKLFYLSEAELTDAAKKKALEGDAQLPVIPGLDVAAGVAHCGKLDLYMGLVNDFYKLIDMKATKIEKCLADEMIRDLTIEVHALKNTTRMLGDASLSEDFKRMEMAGDANDLQTLTRDIPGIIERLRAYKQILSPFVKKGGEKAVSNDELRDIIGVLRACIEAFDLDGADNAMKDLEQCKVPEKLLGKLDELRAYVADVAIEDVVRICDEMIETL